MTDKTDKKIIGYQLVDCEGYNHHEFMGDSFNLKRQDVLRGQAVQFIQNWMKSHVGFELKPVYTGDYSVVNFVNHL
jgi:hypothetical protein